jgi:hypothetical protein
VEGLGAKQTLKVREDYIPFAFSAAAKTRAGLVFAGYGITADEWKYESLRRAQWKVDSVWQPALRQDELWKSNIDGTNPVRITHLDGWKAGGASLFRDGKTIIFREWRSEDAKANKRGLPMDLFTIQSDGTGLKQLTPRGGRGVGRCRCRAPRS